MAFSVEDGSMQSSFPASIDPASLSSFTPASQQLALSGAPNNAAAARSPRIAPANSAAAKAAAADALELSPLRGAQVRKRARVNAVPAPSLSLHASTPSYASISPQQAGGSGGAPSRRASGTPRQAAGAGAGARERASPSQLLKELEGGNAQPVRRPVRSSAVVGGASGASPSAQPEQEPVSNGGKRQRTQGSMRTSRLLSDME